MVLIPAQRGLRWNAINHLMCFDHLSKFFFYLWAWEKSLEVGSHHAWCNPAAEPTKREAFWPQSATLMVLLRVGERFLFFFWWETTFFTFRTWQCNQEMNITFALLRSQWQWDPDLGYLTRRFALEWYGTNMKMFQEKNSCFVVISQDQKNRSRKDVLSIWLQTLLQSNKQALKANYHCSVLLSAAKCQWGCILHCCVIEINSFSFVWISTEQFFRKGANMNNVMHISQKNVLIMTFYHDDLPWSPFPPTTPKNCDGRWSTKRRNNVPNRPFLAGKVCLDCWIFSVLDHFWFCTPHKVQKNKTKVSSAWET